MQADGESCRPVGDPPASAVPNGLALMTDVPLVEMSGLTKSFGATKAVRDVSFEIPPQTVVGLVGENGAGKSTLGRILAGVHRPDRGQFMVNGTPQSFGSPHEALKAGIAMMAQEIQLVPDQTVEENVLLGNLPRRGLFPDRARMRSRFNELVTLSGFNLSPRSRVGDLRLADQQKVEIMRALATEARLIVMDEPSSALTADEVALLHDSIRSITKRGSSILLISHMLEEVLEVSSLVAVMRDGELIRFGPTEDETVDSLVAGMVGRSVSTQYGSPKKRTENAPVVLDITGLSRTGVLFDIDFEVRAGEILGLAGLVGSGRTEIARSIFGADPVDGGTIRINGERVVVRHPGEALGQGMFMVPESRKDQGLLLDASVRDNMLLCTLTTRGRSGILPRGWGTAGAALADQIGLRYRNLGQTVRSLSGGNQQKTLFGRALDVSPDVLIVDEPTRGVDIAAKRAIHSLLESLAAEGVAVLFISSELEEVLGVCNRVLVVHRGRIKAEFTPPYDENQVLGAFFGA